MKALLCKTFGLPEELTITEIPAPPISPQQVRIAVEACGVNYPDVLIIQGKYQIKPGFPFSPGAEVAGKIVEVGKEVSGLKAGDAVVAATGWGGMAAEVAVNASDVFARPNSMSPELGAGFLVTYGTVYHALKNRANLQKGERLLVLGASGGIGLAAIELGKAMGAEVLAAASTQEKLDICQQHGADVGIQYTEEPLKEKVKTLTEGKGVDVVIDPVGGEIAEPAFRAIAWGGRYLVIGFASGEIPRLPWNLPLLKGASIDGVFWSAFRKKQPVAHRQNTEGLLEMFGNGMLHPYVHETFPLEEGGKAIRQLMDRQAMGKLVVRVG